MRIPDDAEGDGEGDGVVIAASTGSLLVTRVTAG
jgi:hypothetical protein